MTRVSAVRNDVLVADTEPDPLREKILSIDINQTTPLEALMLLESLKEDADA